MDNTFAGIDPKALFQDLVALRRDLHRYPEPGWCEFRTTVKILEQLDLPGISVRFGRAIHSPAHMYGLPTAAQLEAAAARAEQQTGRADLIEQMRGGFTGCIAEITGEKPGPTVAVRVDIDCNEVAESTDPAHLPQKLGFASCHTDLMHACGHDAHAAIGIGLARMLAQNRAALAGRVLVVFQPAEEGLRGARSITESGALDGVDHILGGHVGLSLGRLGAVAVGAHGFLASTKFDVVFEGKAAHAGASPEQGNNALAAAATAVLNLLAIPRHSQGSSRINIGTLHGGTGRNVIPARAEMTIETRGLTGEINEYMQNKAERVCRAAAEMYECAYHSTFMGAAGSAVCDPAMVALAAKTAQTVEGVTEVLADIDFGGGEDFTTMMARVQQQGGTATQMVFGTPIAAPHHNGGFDIDEQVMPLAVRLYAALVLRLGGQG